ncbi:MAG: copper homeostasis protein CutC [Anaerolineae bacterium]|nr:copper homeostasis protein CutC [Anaerolineae bacterium]
MSIVLEICIDSVESAIAAQEGGANRVELCANLLEGGTTPSAGTIALARKHIEIDLNVIIRPRGGDFLVSEIEFEVMKYDIEQAKQLGANGVVIGLLNADGSVDAARTAALVKLARPLSVTFHRAFDMARDPYEALETLISLGIDRVLTTGQESSALEGLDLITELVRQAANRIIIMPGLSSGVSEQTVRKIVSQSGAREIHTTASVSLDSGMTFRNPRSFMGGELRPPEFARMVTDARRVSEFVKAIR